MTPPTSTWDVRVAPIPAANVFTTLVRSPYLLAARHGTEHHSMVLADKALRADLGLKPDSVDAQPDSYVGPAFLGPLG
jgi:hypothetical protein